MDATDVMNGADVTDGVADVAGVPTERLEAEICSLGGQLAAMECRWLLLVGEFDRRRGFDSWQCNSTAHWLSWKCALGSRTAHEKVRVARRLDELPLVTAAFARGELSYSKVRALTRIAVATTEADLVSMARHATGAQIERLAAGRRKVDRLKAEHDGDGDPGYSVRWWHDEGDAVVIKARLAPESGAVVVKALEEAIRQERATQSESGAEGQPGTDPGGRSDGNGSRKCSAERSPTDPHDHDHTGGESRSGAEQAGRSNRSGSQKCSAEHSRRKGDRCPAGVDCPNRDKAATAADALVAMADAYLAHPDRLRTGGDRYTTLVLVDEDTLTGDDPYGSVTLDDGTHIETTTARRLACDGARQPIIRRADGTLIDAGHQTRTVNRATRRALKIRDGGCVFPGCGRTHWVDAHHIIHWADHGPTDMTNLILLCRHHHRAIHEGGYTISGNPQAGPDTFHRPGGTPVDPNCEHVITTADQAAEHLRTLDPELTIGPGTITGHYAGDPLLLGYTVANLIATEHGPGHKDNQVAAGFDPAVTKAAYDSWFGSSRSSS